MKKILALVLAVMMLSTMAFAFSTPGTKLKFDISGDMPILGVPEFVISDVPGRTDTTAMYDVIAKATAAKILVGTDDVVLVVTGSDWTTDHKEVNSKNFSLSNIKWTKNSALVKSLTINDDGELVLELKQDYTLAASKKNVAGTFKVTEKGKSKSREFTLGGNITVQFVEAECTIAGTTTAVGDKITGDAAVKTEWPTLGTSLSLDLLVGYKEVTELLDNVNVDTSEEFIYKFKKNNDVSYETISFTDALDNDVEVRVYADEKYFLYSEATADLDVVKKYDDTGAVLDFVSFPGVPTFNATATYRFYVDEDQFIYTIKNGAVTASGAKWDNDEGCWILKTRTLGSYVISDMKLAATSTSTTDTDVSNPDTGANDVVGIATALAAVALISAAAVSLKK